MAVPGLHYEHLLLVCSLCGGNHSAAFLSGRSEVFVCGGCAGEISPLLISDAAVGKRLANHTGEQIERALVQVEKLFLRDVLYSLLRSGEK